MTPAMAWEWNIAIFCMNEAKTIATCINSVADAIGNRRALITLVVNGSTDRSAEIAWQTAQSRDVPIRIYTIPHADKANAINRFYYELRQPAEVYFFVDAYVKVGLLAFQANRTSDSLDCDKKA
jgi:glycosyltransferase involved in cell wall biosynthesis